MWKVWFPGCRFNCRRCVRHRIVSRIKRSGVCNFRYPASCSSSLLHTSARNYECTF